MSLNAELITAALNALVELPGVLARNNELLSEAAEGRERAIAAAQAASAPKTPAKAKADTKASTAATETAAAATTAAAETVADGFPTIDDVNASITKYGGGTDRAEERDARVTKIMEIIGKVAVEGHEGPLNAAAIKPDMREAFIKTMEDFCTRPDLTEVSAASSANALLG